METTLTEECYINQRALFAQLALISTMAYASERQVKKYPTREVASEARRFVDRLREYREEFPGQKLPPGKVQQLVPFILDFMAGKEASHYFESDLVEDFKNLLVEATVA